MNQIFQYLEQHALYAIPALIIVAWLGTYLFGLYIKGIFKKTAEQLGLNYEGAFLLRNCRVSGQYKGYPVEIKYKKQSIKTYDQGKTGYNRFYTAQLVVDIRGRTEEEYFSMDHPHSREYYAVNGFIYYPPYHIRHSYFSLSRHFFSVESIQYHLDVMIQWADELTE